MKRTLALALAVMLLIALFAGCGGNNAGGATAGGNNAGGSAGDPAVSDAGTEAGTESEGEDAAEASPYRFAAGNYEVDEEGYPLDWYDYTLPISTTDEILSFWCHCYMPQYLGAEGFSEEAYHQTVEKETGIHVEFVLSSWNERQTQFSVLQAGGDLPDMVSQAGMFISGSKANNIAEGYFANIYDYKDYAPNYMYAVKELSAKQAAVADACFVEPETIFEFVCLYDTPLPSLALVGIRNDWLVKMGTSVDQVKTTDQLHDVLLAFKSQFNCTYPWWMCDTVDNGNWFACFDVNTILDNVYQSFFPSPSVKDGTVQFYYSNDNALEFITMINQWIGEGLVSPNWIDPLGGVGDAEIAQGIIGTNPVLPATLEQMNDKTEDPDADWQILPRTVRYEGQVLHLGDDKSYYNTYNCGTSINAECENIELAMSWLDWRYSPDGAFLGSYGVENEMWEYNDEGEIVRIEEMRLDPNFMWYTVIKSANYMSEHGYKLMAADYAYEGGQEILQMSQAYYDTYTCDNAYLWPVGATLSDEQSMEFMNYGGDIATYLQEHIIMFCTGDKPLSEWDDYIGTLNEMGLQEALAVYQECYDGYLSRKAA